MNFMLPFEVPKLPQLLGHRHTTLILGSCFAEHIAARLHKFKFETCLNPHGIIFNPKSMAASLEACIDTRQYTQGELFQWNEIWGHWDFHTRFSNTDAAAALEAMNASVRHAADFVRKADWLLLTFGTAWQYVLQMPQSDDEGRTVANCHKAPGKWFQRTLSDVSATVAEWTVLLAKLRHMNPDIKILLTVSPVRHIREGIVDNNRSKACLLEVVHQLKELVPDCYYFPAYELVMDVLRDYRFFETDMVHPNSQAVQFVWEHFRDACLTNDAVGLLYELEPILTAASHRPRFPGTAADRAFRTAILQKCKDLKSKFTYLDLSGELEQFQTASI
jgi:hypothetical protein